MVSLLELIYSPILAGGKSVRRSMIVTSVSEIRCLHHASVQLMDTRSDRMTRWICTAFLYQGTERNLTSTQNLAMHGGLELIDGSDQFCSFGAGGVA
jgi:hypothetical protein